MGIPCRPGSGLCLSGFGKKPQAGSEARAAICPATQSSGGAGQPPGPFYKQRVLLPGLRALQVTCSLHCKRGGGRSSPELGRWSRAIGEVCCSLDATAILSTKCLRADCAQSWAEGRLQRREKTRGLHRTAAFCPCRTPKHPPTHLSLLLPPLKPPAHPIPSRAAPLQTAWLEGRESASQQDQVAGSSLEGLRRRRAAREPAPHMEGSWELSCSPWLEGSPLQKGAGAWRLCVGADRSQGHPQGHRAGG